MEESRQRNRRKGRRPARRPSQGYSRDMGASAKRPPRLQKEGPRRQAGSGKPSERKKRKGALILLLVAAFVFILSAVMLVVNILPYFQGDAEYDEIRSLAVQEGASAGDETGFRVDFDQLKAINSDTVAWIRFEEPSIISYPVVQGRDNDQYITQTFQANDNKLGAIFMDVANDPGFTDRNTILYGHHMNVGGAMFSQLNSYDDPAFREAHPYFYIYTPDGRVRTYEIFSAGVVSATLDNYPTSFASDAEYLAYLQKALANSAYDMGVDLDVEDRIVSLSTCTNVRDTERYLLQGVLVEEESVSQNGSQGEN